jgi:hypothetical protein
MMAGQGTQRSKTKLIQTGRKWNNKKRAKKEENRSILTHSDSEDFVHRRPPTRCHDGQLALRCNETVKSDDRDIDQNHGTIPLEKEDSAIGYPRRKEFFSVCV